MHDLVIIGGGAASQAAAMYALGKQIDFLLICERLGRPDALVAQPEFDEVVADVCIDLRYPDLQDEEHHLIGSSAVHLFERQLSRQPTRLLLDRVVRVDQFGSRFVIDTQRVKGLNAGAVIVATGAAPRRLDAVTGAELLIGMVHGVTSHSDEVAGMVVAVIGDSEQAIYNAADLSRQARHVYLLLLHAHAVELPEVQLVRRRPNLEVLAGYRLLEVRGTSTARELLLVRGDEPLTLVVDCAFADPGSEPASSLVRHMARTSTDGFIQVDRGFATSVPGLFAAGEVTHPEGEQVLASIGDGARAARSAHFYLLTRLVARNKESLRADHPLRYNPS